MDLLKLVAFWAVSLTVSLGLLTAVTEGALVVAAVPRRGLRWSLLNAGLNLVWLVVVGLVLAIAAAPPPVAVGAILLTSPVAFVLLAKVLHRASVGKAMLVVLTSALLAFVFVMTVLRVGAYFE